VGLFDVATGEQTNSLAQGMPVWAMAFSADNLKLAMISNEQGIKPIIWDMAANVPSALLADQLEGVDSIGFSADQTMAATGTNSGVVTVYHLESDTPPALWSVDINTLQMVIDLQFGAPIPVTNVIFSPDGTKLAASSAGLGVLVIFNTSDGSVVSSGNAMYHIAGPVATAMLAPNDWSKVYWLSRGSVIAVDLATNEEAGKFSHEDFIQGIAFSADGSILATASGVTINGEFQPAITLWDTSNYQMLRQITGFAQIPPALAFSADGSKLAIGVNGEGIALWGLVQNR
jgi:WD40 repeat protein